MTFLVEKSEPSVVASVNWTVLAYLIERFNRTALEGCIILRRNPLRNALQLCLSAECNGQTLSLQSEPFGDMLLTESEEREQLIRVVSRFLLKAKHDHAQLLDPVTPVSSNSLADLVGEEVRPVELRRELPDEATSVESETLDDSAG